MRRFLFVVVSAILCQLTHAQNAVIKGLITDADTQEPLIGATIFLSNQTGAATGIDGTFEFESVAGTYTLTISYVGYLKQSNEIILTAGQVLVLNNSLVPDKKLFLLMLLNKPSLITPMMLNWIKPYSECRVYV